MATLAMKASRHVSWRRTWMGGVLAVGAFVALIAGYMLVRALGVGPFGSLFAAGTLQKNERLLVADFTISASDSSMGPVITDAFRTALGQSRSITVMQPTDMRDVLRRMQKAGNTHVDFPVAREIATREGIRAVLLGDVVSLGGNYAVAVRLVSPQTGDELANFRQTAEGAKELLPAIDKLAKDLRAKIGESMRTVQASMPLERVTTPSLEALKKYVQATRLLDNSQDFPKGAALMEEAVAMDTGFAMAYRRLAMEYSNRFDMDRAMQLMQKAYDHRDRLSDAERYLVIAGYFERGPHQDGAKSVAAYESLLDLQPNFPTALNNLGVAYMGQRQFEKAEEYYRRSIGTGIAPVVSYTGLASALWQQGKHDEVRRVLERADSIFPGSISVAQLRSRVLYLEGQHDSAAVVAEKLMRERPNDVAVAALNSGFVGAVASAHARLREAAKWQQKAEEANARRGLQQAALNFAATQAMTRVWFFNDRSGVAALDRALVTHPIEQLPVASRPYVQIAIPYALAGRADRVHDLYASFNRARKNVQQLNDSVAAHTLEGLQAFAEKRYRDAATEFRRADVTGCITCATALTANSWDLAGQPDSAIATYESYVQRDDGTRYLRDAWYLAGSHKRLGELYEAKGDRQNALSHYLKFIDLWKDADPELQPKVAEVRAGVARLKDQERK
jgi:tetratricopeptide (TPR) repeat protein